MLRNIISPNIINPHIPNISKFGIIITICFIFLSLIGRFLFPFGDEPDFIYRTFLLVNSEHSWWSPYFLFQNILSEVNINSECSVNAGALSLWTSIDSYSCTEDIKQILYRLLMTVIIVLPLLVVLVFQKTFIILMKITGITKDNAEWSARFHSLGLSLLFPSVIYYLGVFSSEQFSLVLSLLIFLVWRTLYIIPLIILIFMVDFGNSLVVSTFIVIYYILDFCLKKWSLGSVSFIIFLSMICILLFRTHIFGVLENIPFLSVKLNSMEELLEAKNLVDKYPVLLRPVITFMTGIFMTPSGIKVPAIYIFIFLLITFKLRILKNKRVSFFNQALMHEKITFLYTSISTILSFVFLLPNYVNAKYYIFMLPFFIFTYLDLNAIKRIFWVFLAISSTTFIHLLFYRL